MTTTDTHREAAEEIMNLPQFHARFYYTRHSRINDIAEILSLHFPSQPPTADAEELAGKLIERVLEHTSGGRTYLRTSLMDEFTPLLAPLVSENAELKQKIHGACVWLQGGGDVEKAAKSMFETNLSNQQGFIRVSDQLAKAKGVVDECREALASGLTICKDFQTDDECAKGIDLIHAINTKALAAAATEFLGKETV